MTSDHEHRYTLPASAIRTLGALERTLRRHMTDLERLDCEDLEAAEAIVFAIQQTENALRNTQAAKKALFDAAKKSDGCEFCNQHFNRPEDGAFTCPYCRKKWRSGPTAENCE